MTVERCDQQYKRYKKELDYVIKEVLNQEDDSDIEYTLKKHGYKTVLAIVSTIVKLKKLTLKMIQVMSLN